MKCVSKNHYLQVFVLKLKNNMSNFQPLDVVGRGSETQLQVSENLNKLTWHDKVNKTHQRYLYIFFFQVTLAIIVRLILMSVHRIPVKITPIVRIT